MARDESGGLIDTVTDRQILSAYRLLAKEEGVFVEPASAASVAGMLKLSERGYFRKMRARARTGKTVRIVCILTGHGLKDPDRVLKTIKEPKAVKPDLKIILREIGY